ncbi:hypothetical protein CI109_101053 [Kwoniella shandongensis]|uniref:Uncharacterized protein n=1 Tax=Kwoniella shandongensis TaxID=1734106 RepID=A0A5M6C4L7_9TREE|nr:uncharacterized protein CI109_001522 [Kwoniella shandongensis]KAA5530117.1 hypothetical protein CI109_001522 [Kwoniella shandongensis]
MILDQAVATVPSTPPLPAPLLSGLGTFPSPITPAQPIFQQQQQQQHQQYVGDQFADPGGSGGGDYKVSEPWTFNAFSSPPSPSTIASTSDSQTGGECFPPSSESAEGDNSSTRSGSGSSRRRNLSLNIGSLAFQNGSIQSPTSLASSGAPYTDSFSSSHNVDYGQDYFHFADGSFSSTGEGSFSAQIPLAAQQPGQKLPASQPSSPARGVYQLPYGLQSGRQRGATFSGSFYPYNQNGGPVSFFPPNMAQSIPPHLAFTSMQSPAHSPLAPSPVITASPSQLQGEGHPFFGLQQQQQQQQQQQTMLGLGMQEILMEDVSTPTAVLPQMMPAPISRKVSSGHLAQAAGSMTPDMSAEMVDKLSLLDKIVSSAQSAKDALLRGHEMEVSTSLGDISNHLETASELGVGPVPTQKDINTPNSQSVSPINTTFQSSPVVQTSGGMPSASSYPSQLVQTPVTSQMSTMPMTIQTQGLLPSLPVDQSGMTAKRAVSDAPLNGTAKGIPSNAEYLNNKLQAPPLVHSHSFPNGHQLPSQMQGTMTPTTPVVPSPTFIAAIGAHHMPMISSPLATIPPSRPPSPPRYTVPVQTWDNSMANADVIMSQQQPSSQPIMERRASQSERADGRPIVRGRSTSVNKQWSHTAMTASMPPSAWQSRQGSPDDADDDESEDEEPRRTKRRRSSAGADGANGDLANGVVISDDIRRQLDQIFEEFLNHVCSDLEVVDSKGEKLHQVLMPKKMQRLDESTDYRPFKFRIQAFTNAFTEELQNRGITEDTMSAKKIKTYLWRQDLISRFNPDGKKAKSKGNHIWNVDAKKLPGGGWVFRPFKRRIIGQPNPFALVNQKYEWEPRIWDPQAASDTIKPTFQSPAGSLPPWLQWEDGKKLVGVPDQPSAPMTIPVMAEFIDGSGMLCTLEIAFTVQAVAHIMPITDAAALYAQAGFNPYDFGEQGAHLNLLTPSTMTYTGNMVYPQPGSYPSQ